MEFYQKLQKLRRESGMSQEELAGHLNVSRQAVSKWENAQGYPETDKLLQISGLFSVSVDYLLKQESPAAEAGEVDDGSYYASREMVDAFLLARRQSGLQIATGVAVLILSFIWFALLPESLGAILWFLQVAIGVGTLVLVAFRPKRFAPEMEERALSFDPAFIREFKAGYQQVRKRCGYLIVGGIVLVILGIASAILLEELGGLGDMQVVTVLFLFIAAAVFCIILGASRLSAHSLIANNEQQVREREEESRYGWVYGATMTLAAAVFLFLMFGQRGGGMAAQAGPPAWIVFPIAALLGAVITAIMRGVRGSRK